MNQTKQENELWNQIVEDLKVRGNVGAYGFESYISKLSLAGDTGTKLIIRYPQGMPIEWVEVNYLKALLNSVTRVMAAARQIEFMEDGCEMAIEQAEAPVTTTAIARPQQAPAKNIAKNTASRRSTKTGKQSTGLNEDYTFDSYVVGPNNEFTCAAAKAVVKSPSGLYNPFFVHGESGLGKTHLLQAMGNAIRANNSNVQVLYVTSEDFTNAYIDAIGKKGDALNAFRRKYRKADVLLIDDVQFLARTGRTQEEFFHTFNALFDSGKQIILSADCPASCITNLDARLASRFEQGLTVNLLPPCYETRVAIVRQKLKQWKAEPLSAEIIDFLAKNITHSVRALEGALVRLTTYASFSHRALTVADARMQLQDLMQQDRNAPKIAISDIQQRVADEFNIRLADINGRRRTAAIAHPRQVAMYLARQHTGCSLQDIGAAFGGRDHGTVLHAARAIEQKMQEDTSLRELINRVAASFV